MSFARIAAFAFLATAMLLTSAWAGGNPEDYLTKDGKLTQALDIRDLQGGFAGFTGNYYKVETDGKWSTGQVFNQKLTEEGSGTLSKDELMVLARALARYELTSLKTSGKVGTNPHVVTIKFGKTEHTLTLGAGEMLPKVEINKAKLPVEQRYSGIVQSVRELMGKKDKRKG